MTALLVLASLNLVVGLIDLVVDLYETRPVRRRHQLLELATSACAAAEQRHAGDDGAEKARYAREYVLQMGRHLKVSPAQADMLVHHALSKLAG